MCQCQACGSNGQGAGKSCACQKIEMILYCFNLPASMLNKALHSALKMEASNSSITGLRAHMAQEMNSAIAGATSIFLHIVANGFHFDMSCTLARGYLQAAWLPSNSWCGHISISLCYGQQYGKSSRLLFLPLGPQ